MDGTYTVGVDLGGTNLRIAAYANGVDFLETIVLPTRLSEGRERVVRDMCEAVQSLASTKYGERRLIGIGIGTPGPLELPNGILHGPPNLPGWSEFNLRSSIESTLGRSVEIESDANLAALAEHRLGVGKSEGIDSLCVLTLGTGVGSGIILGGNIWHGITGMGGEAGHVIVESTNGAPCGCGGYGCLEQYASATAAVRMAREVMPDASSLTSHAVAHLAINGDVKARMVMERIGRYLAIGLTGLINTLNLPVYAIGGGLSDAWELFSPVMFDELHRRCYIYRLTCPDGEVSVVHEHDRTHILQAKLGANAGLLGACLLAGQSKVS